MKINKLLKIVALGLFLSGSASSYAQFNLGSLFGKVKDTVTNLTSTSKFEANDLVGNWKYQSPAVSMKGDNTLANIGGAVGATAIEDKLAPYYERFGLQKTTLEVNNDLSFTFTVGAIKLTGTIEKSKDTDLVFNFKAFNKIKIGKVNCIATKSGNTVSLTFDAQKILSLVQTISSLSSNSTIQSVNSILSNYKDMYLGLKMTRQ